MKFLFSNALAFTVCLAAFPCLAQADTQGHAPGKFYAGLNAGIATTDAEVVDLVPSFATRDLSDNATGYKVRIGYQFVKWVALEVAYVDFGKVSFETNSYAVQSHANGLLVNVIGTWPITERWSVNGQLGAMHTRNKTTEVSSTNYTSSGHDSQSNTAFEFGVGVKFAVSNRVDLELDWAQFDQFGLGLPMGRLTPVFSLGSSDLTSLGLRFRF